MTLADRLRAAMANGRTRSTVLIPSDFMEEEEPGPPGVPAAVLVPVVDRPDPGVLLTLRPETMRRHAGQISFPGGRIDPEDDGPVAAALREAQEEIGLPPALVDVIGTGDVYRTVTGFAVTPVLAVVPPDLPLTPHPGEVADAFEVPFRVLLDPAHHHLQQMHWRGQQRLYYQIDVNGRRVWGATAAMIVNLSRRLDMRW